MSKVCATTAHIRSVIRDLEILGAAFVALVQMILYILQKSFSSARQASLCLSPHGASTTSRAGVRRGQHTAPEVGQRRVPAEGSPEATRGGAPAPPRPHGMPEGCAMTSLPCYLNVTLAAAHIVGASFVFTGGPISPLLFQEEAEENAKRQKVAANMGIVVRQPLNQGAIIQRDYADVSRCRQCLQASLESSTCFSRLTDKTQPRQHRGEC